MQSRGLDDMHSNQPRQPLHQSLNFNFGFYFVFVVVCLDSDSDASGEGLDAEFSPSKKEEKKEKREEYDEYPEGVDPTESDLEFDDALEDAEVLRNTLSSCNRFSSFFL